METHESTAYRWPAFALTLLAGAALLYATYEASNSEDLQALALLVAALAAGSVSRRGRPTRVGPRRDGAGLWRLVLAAVVDAAAIVLLANGGALVGFYPGIWFWFYLGLVCPLAFFSAYYGEVVRP
jgi:drug/metabolite transporter (DMT)-like permease